MNFVLGYDRFQRAGETLARKLNGQGPMTKVKAGKKCLRTAHGLAV